MNFFTALLNSLPGAVGQGLIWGLMAIGVYLTFRILDVADLTVDGSLATGGAVCVMLIRGGVKIYEYTPGFIHSKMFVSDDQVAIVGTANMDYRSFQLHCECGTLLTGSAGAAVQEDMDDILEKSRRVTLAAWRKRKWYVKILGAVLRPFAMWM